MHLCMILNTQYSQNSFSTQDESQRFTWVQECKFPGLVNDNRLRTRMARSAIHVSGSPDSIPRTSDGQFYGWRVRGKMAEDERAEQKEALPTQRKAFSFFTYKIGFVSPSIAAHLTGHLGQPPKDRSSFSCLPPEAELCHFHASLGHPKFWNRVQRKA